MKPAGKTILEGVGAFLQKYPRNAMVVKGHTDSQGSQAANETISEKRGQKVREYLVMNQNIDPNRISAEGSGPTQPAATNATEAGRALNRRVEVPCSWRINGFVKSPSASLRFNFAVATNEKRAEGVGLRG